MQSIKNPIDKYFEKLTNYHYYFFFLLFLSKLPVFWHVLSLIFVSPPMTYKCNGVVDQCPCKNPVWDKSVFSETFQTKYGVLCDRKWLVSFSQSMVYVGTLLGALTFGFASDKMGRLPTFCICCLTVAVAGCLVRFMPSAATFIFMRCVEGIGVGGSIVTGYVILVEYCGTSYREMTSALYHIPINLGHTSLAGMSYLIRHCDDLQLALSVPMFLFVAMWCVCLESPKWLMDVGKLDKATKVMEQIERFNKRPTGNIKGELEAYYATQASSRAAKLSFFHIFRYKKLTINLVCMSIIYFGCGMGYYGVSQYIGKMSGDIHANVAISGALLIPGTICAAFLLRILGRRTFLMGTTFLSGSFMIIVVIIPASAATARVFIACICNCFFFMSFIIVFLYGTELFPTSIRNSVLGFLSVLSRVGQICAPPINALPQTVSGTIFGLIAILGGILCLPLPETKNLDLPSNLEDTKNQPTVRRLSGRTNATPAPERTNAPNAPNATSERPNVTPEKK